MKLISSIEGRQERRRVVANKPTHSAGLDQRSFLPRLIQIRCHALTRLLEVNPPAKMPHLIYIFCDSTPVWLGGKRQFAVVRSDSRTASECNSSRFAGKRSFPSAAANLITNGCGVLPRHQSHHAQLAGHAGLAVRPVVRGRQ